MSNWIWDVFDNLLLVCVGAGGSWRGLSSAGKPFLKLYPRHTHTHYSLGWGPCTDLALGA